MTNPLDPNQPAFPSPTVFRPTDGHLWHDEIPGIPLRLYIAAKVAAALAAVEGPTTEDVATDAFDIADALIRQHNEHVPREDVADLRAKLAATEKELGSTLKDLHALQRSLDDCRKQLAEELQHREVGALLLDDLRERARIAEKERDALRAMFERDELPNGMVAIDAELLDHYVDAEKERNEMRAAFADFRSKLSRRGSMKASAGRSMKANRSTIRKPLEPKSDQS